MRYLTRRLDNRVQDIKEQLDTLAIVESEASLVAAALNQVSWHVYELRRRLALEQRAAGRSWAQIGASMGISKQSAMAQWAQVDGELQANRQPELPL
jgi:hypothetical protein